MSGPPLDKVEGAKELFRIEGTRLVHQSGAEIDGSVYAAGVSPLKWPEYNVDEMNREFGVVMLGKGVMILWERPRAKPDEQIRLITVDAFRILSQNAVHYYTDDKGKLRTISYASKWLADRDRRDFAGMEFHPNPDGAEGTPGYLNLWKGFSVAPSIEGEWTILRDHMLTNVCNGDLALFKWLFGWFAQIVQEPRRKPGTSIVLRGGMGYGKSIVGEVMGSLFDRHYVLVDEARYLTGNFNVHMASCLLLQADEAIWAGDKAAEGRLKGLVTASSQMIESKGVDPVRIDNHLRVMMTSNNDWVVPAGKDERRFAIFDVAGHAAQNHGYFAEMLAELESGGRRRLLHDLLTFDLSQVNIRQIPKTTALLEQKVHSLDPIDAWLLDRLQAGSPTRAGNSWPDWISNRALLDDYTVAADKVGVHRKSFETQFGMKFLKLMPGAKKQRQSVQLNDTSATERVWGYVLPPLDRARDAFEESLGQTIDWDRSDETWDPDAHG